MAIEALRDRRWILLPGTLCTGAVFEDFLDIAGVGEAQRDVIDMRHANVADYAEELAKVMRPGAVVCGFSLGAMVAAHHADWLDAALLLLFGVNPFPDDPKKLEGRRDLERAVHLDGGDKALRPLLPVFNNPHPELVEGRILDMAKQAAPMISAQTELAIGRPGALSILARTTCPTIVLTGDRDEQTPFALGEQAARAAPSGRAVPLAGLGHYALMEDPQACFAALSKVWSELG
ncbi:MAG TPA: alpha/beta hydrolase [Devosiaceae bacterium]